MAPYLQCSRDAGLEPSSERSLRQKKAFIWAQVSLSTHDDEHVHHHVHGDYDFSLVLPGTPHGDTVEAKFKVVRSGVEVPFKASTPPS